MEPATETVRNETVTVWPPGTAILEDGTTTLYTTSSREEDVIIDFLPSPPRRGAVGTFTDTIIRPR